MHYQPIADLETRQITGFEALLRWQHPEQGLISPDKFMAAAEDSGLLVAAGQWLMQEACKQLSVWTSEIPAMASVSMSVNVSARQLADARFATGVETILRQTGVGPSRLRLEITENVAAADSKLAATVVSHLKHLRVGVILDDFGTGNSSLSGLRQFPVDALKIDRSLVAGMLTDRGTCDTLELIILLAHKLKFKVIAEGIETSRQLDQLHTLGCDLGQGHLFSQPVEARAAEDLLRQASPIPRIRVAGAQ